MMNFERVMLREISQIKTNNCTISLICGILKKWTQKPSKLMVPRGRWRSGKING